MERLRHYVDQAHKVIIVGHFNPDGDAVGSSLALNYYLKNLSKDVRVIFPNPYPGNLNWMDPENYSHIFTKEEENLIADIQAADTIFCMDCRSFSRTDKMYPYLQEAKAVKILIDHHIDPENESFDLVFSRTDLSSTCEILYHVLTHELFSEFIDAKVASCLYAGICTDTGCFSYSCKHPELFDCVADLVRLGANPVDIHTRIYDTFSEERMRLLGFCLSERLVVLKEYQTAFIYLTKEEMLRFNHQAGDTEGVVHYALSIDGMKFAALFTERDDRIRISFRSKGEVDVNFFASAYFNGGGHKNASGGSSLDDMPTTLEKFRALVPGFYKAYIEGK